MRKLLNISGLAIILILVGLTIGNINTANAQASFGAKGGVSFANISDTDGNSLDSRTGLLVGGYATIPLSNASFTIQPELLYVSKGATTTGVNLFGQPVPDADITYKFDYIEVPVLAKYNFQAGGSSMKPYVEVGPYLGFNVNGEVEIDANQGGGTFDVSDQLSGTDFGLAAGAGVKVSGFNISARYDLGLSEISDGSEINNSALFFTAGYSF